MSATDIGYAIGWGAARGVLWMAMLFTVAYLLHLLRRF